MRPDSLAPLFAALGLIFLGLAVRDYLKAEAKLTPARTTWLTIGFIFAAVAIGLVALSVLIP